MRIALLNASSQAGKNQQLFEISQRVLVPMGHQLLNLGVTPDEPGKFSYVDVAVEIAALINTRAVDFVITGCSSGNGMMLACNSFPNVICGYASSPTEAALFGMINNGNVLSFPLGYQFGWAGELTFEYTIEKLFANGFGSGYPASQATRKQHDTQVLKQIRSVNYHSFAECLELMDSQYLQHALSRKPVLDAIKQFGGDAHLVDQVLKSEQ